MTGESQPELCHKDPLDGALSGLWFIWLGLLVGSGIILMVLCAIVFFGGSCGCGPWRCQAKTITWPWWSRLGADFREKSDRCSGFTLMLRIAKV